MKMESGYVDLFSIFEFVAKNPKIPGGKNPGFRPYSILCDKLARDIPKQSGWYFWGRFNKDSNWECFYVGKAEKTQKKWSLYNRIRDELKEERVFAWAYVVGDNKAFRDQSRAYNKKFDKSNRRAIKKKGTHFIIWVSDFDIIKKQVTDEERALIGYYNPVCNIQRGKTKQLTPTTKKIIKFIKYEACRILKSNQSYGMLDARRLTSHKHEGLVELEEKLHKKAMR